MYNQADKINVPKASINAEQETEFSRRIFDLEIEIWMLILTSPLTRSYALLEIKFSLENNSKRNSTGQLLKEIYRLWKLEQQPGKSKISSHSSDESSFTLAEFIREWDKERHVFTKLRKSTLETLEKKSNVIEARNLYVDITGRSDLLESLQHRFIQMNQHIVHAVARQYRRSRMPLDDMIQEGNLGLIRAMNRFDYRLGYRFSSYASWWVKNAINRAIDTTENAVRVPLSTLRTSRQLMRAAQAFQAKHGYSPGDEEMLRKTGMGARRFAHAKRFSSTPVSSLYQRVSNSSNTLFIDTLQDHQTASPHHLSLLNIWHSRLRDLMEDLTPQERNILRWRFGLDDWDEMPLEKIGQLMGMSREGIRQIQKRALNKLRQQFAPDMA